MGVSGALMGSTYGSGVGRSLPELLLALFLIIFASIFSLENIIVRSREHLLFFYFRGDFWTGYRIFHSIYDYCCHCGSSCRNIYATGVVNDKLNQGLFCSIGPAYLLCNFNHYRFRNSDTNLLLGIIARNS
jgi:hypothetical protein